ncbi:hypothetical protein Sked_28280 [Sanguibacter keddieii DSM 10542]|uniref:Integral membrane protein n=1 Tax=Sanguibacter keddieii (strain ATCC 51767 / DSM 10542 / NCFB 3025 / ST-74) TaxID=446469 RepID=D1BB29_SANKS|nr:hypothetical protein [Sanguibacter keddieii]ACZ22730.1 hypothetical protein Sked_28280 [Sanguibacter keddieii DSM 10542]
MDFLYNAIVVLHLVGWAIVLGGYIATVRQPGVYRGTFHGAATALVTGILLVGLAESVDSLGKDPSMVKIGIKLVVALAVTVLALVAKKKGDQVAPGVKHAIGGLTLVNIVIAVFV